MKIKVWFIIAVIFVIITGTACFAEIQVDYTNQFFVSKIDEGYCYVFLYLEPEGSKITFVKYNEKNGSSEKIDINVSVNKISNIFIIKNELFIMLADNVFSIYDISELVKGENDNKILEDLLEKGQLECDSFALYEDSLFFTKGKKPQVYEYTGKMNSTLIKNVNIDSAADYSFFQYNPISESREKRYNELLAGLDREVRELTDKRNTITLAEGKMPSRTGAKNPVPDDIYGKMKEDIARIDSLNIDKYTDIFTLASIIEKADTEITTKIRPLNARLTTIDSAITNYYTQATKINNLNTTDTVGKRKSDITGRIEAHQKNMTGKYLGIKIEEMENNYIRYNEIINSSKYKWELSAKKNFNEEYDKNKNIIADYDEELMKLSSNKIVDQNYSIEEVQYYKALHKFIEDNKSNRIIDSTGIKELACENGKRINDMQRTTAEKYIRENLLNNYTLQQFHSDIANYNTNFNLENVKLGKVDSEWNNELASAQTAKNTAFKTITDYCINRYFNEKYTALSKLKNQNNNSLPGDYNKQYRNFIKVSGAGNTIYGFKDSQTINYQEVRLLENNDGKPVRYIRPDSNNLVRFIDDTSVLLLKDLNEIVKYDLTVLNKITPKSIKPLKEIFYVLGSGKSYYYVTKDEELYEVNGNEPVLPDKISADDTVLITTQGEEDFIYILKKNGDIKVSGRGSSKTELSIKPVNDGAVQKISIKDKKFIFQVKA